MKQKVLFLSVFSCWMLLLCLANTSFLHAQDKKKEKKQKKTIKTIEKSNKSESEIAEYMFIEAMGIDIQGDSKEAIRRFLSVEELNPKNATVKYKIAENLYKLQEFDRAETYINAALNLDDKNPFFFLLYAQILKAQNEPQKAIESFKNAVKLKPSEELYQELAYMYLQNNQFSEALKVYEKSEEQYGFNENISQNKVKVFLLNNQIDNAIKEGNKILEYGAEPYVYLPQHLQILTENNRLDEALALLKSFSEQNPDNPEIELFITEIMQKKGDDTGYLKKLETLFANPSLDYMYKQNVVNEYLRKNLYTEKANKEVVSLLETIVKTHPQNSEAHAAYADCLFTLKRHKEARNEYAKAVKYNGDNFKIWQQLIALDWELNELDSVILHSQFALELFPTQPLLYFYNGLGYQRKGDYKTAIDVFEMGKAYTANNRELAAQINAQLGDAYYQLKRYLDSDNAYEAALKIDNNNLYVLNNYSYYLSLRKEKLDLAKELSLKLVILSPENAAYLDTYGWVLFMRGEYQNAKEYIEKAAFISKDATIHEHLGDVLFKLGNTEAAIVQWKKAYEAGADNPELLQRKLKEGKFLE
jgi:tetratricopeptide (TPR) repeat protein